MILTEFVFGPTQIKKLFGGKNIVGCCAVQWAMWKGGALPPMTGLTVQGTSLLRRLQGKPFPAEAPPIIGKIHLFSKMAVTFEPLMGF